MSSKFTSQMIKITTDSLRRLKMEALILPKGSLASTQNMAGQIDLTNRLINLKKHGKCHAPPLNIRKVLMENFRG